ncbi:MAG: hypothetical protein IPM39_05905 [Chloroflexi bacterium]|nr:hypothetical protein [Chloroflexota bacterium]
MFLENPNKNDFFSPFSYPVNPPKPAPYPVLAESVEKTWRDRVFMGSGQFFITLGSALKEKAQASTAVTSLPTPTNMRCDA